jgi:hypothetical protein
MKHVGKMKNNAARVAVVFRTLPGEANNALVVGTSGLPDAYHDSLMSLIESDTGQQANELADVLASRRFPDGEIMLQWLHSRGQLKKVPTSLVLMTPNTQTAIPLDQVNQAIAESKGIRVEDLAVGENLTAVESKTTETKPTRQREEIIVDTTETTTQDSPITPSDLRSMADKLFKEAQALRRKADEIDPPAKKAKTVKAEA